MTADTPQRIKAQRESQGLTLQALAALSCLSVRQVQQIEEGGLSAFYNEDIKRKATEKVMAVLGVEDQPSSHTSVDTPAHASEPLRAGTIRAEAHHPLAVPPDFPEASPEADAATSDDVASEAPVAASDEAASSQDPKPQASSPWLLWLVSLGLVGAVLYGLGLFPV